MIEKTRSINLIEIKARGKFGAVWKASDRNELVAVKVMTAQVQFEFLLIFYKLQRAVFYQKYFVIKNSKKMNQKIVAEILQSIY